MYYSRSLTLKSQWIKGASKSLPRHREKAAGVQIMEENDGNHNFILTGGLNQMGEPTRTVWVYHHDDDDADDDNRKKVSSSSSYWDTTTFPRLNQERYSHACIIQNQKVYIFGGRDKNGQTLKSVEMLDLKRKSNGWRFLPPMKQARAPLAVSAVGDTIYVFGSQVILDSSDTTTTPPYYNRDIHGSVISFNLRTKRWNRDDRIPPIPKEDQAITGSAVVSGQIYLISTDKKISKKSGQKYRSMVFDPSSSKWLSRKALRGSTKELPDVTVLKRRGKDVLGGSAMVFENDFDDELSVDNEERQCSPNKKSVKSAVTAFAITATIFGMGGIGAYIVSSSTRSSNAGQTDTTTTSATAVSSSKPTNLPTSAPTFPTTTADTTTSATVTRRPTNVPTAAPTLATTALPIILEPTPIPTTSIPTAKLTPQPQLDDRDINGGKLEIELDFSAFLPTAKPSDNPSNPSSLGPSFRSSSSPTALETKFPSASPTVSPTFLESSTPTKEQAEADVLVPTFSPSMLSSTPSKDSSKSPSLIASITPSYEVTLRPVEGPSQSPTSTPSRMTSLQPTVQPTWSPSIRPSTSTPSYPPTTIPSPLPSFTPSNFPTIECNGKCDPTNQVCIDGLCVCIPGFFSPSGKGGRCQCEEECKYDALNNCDRRNAICIEECPGYRCKCKSGFEGNGTQCTDIDECSLDPTICGSNNYYCVNRPGTYECIEKTPAPTTSQPTPQPAPRPTVSPTPIPA